MTAVLKPCLPLPVTMILVVEISGGASLQLQTKFDDNHDRSSAVHFSAFREAADRVTINARPSLIRLGVSALGGSVEIDAPWNGETCAYCHVTLHPDAKVPPLGVSRNTSPPGNHEKCPALAKPQRTNRIYSANSPKIIATIAPTNLPPMFCGPAPCDQADSSTRRSVFMSLNWMDQVWTWDNIFNLLALAESDEDLAFEQLMVVADHQDEHGAYPDGLNDGFKHYNYSKPPVQGVLFAWLEQRQPNFFTPTRRREAYDTVSRFTNWWLNHRLSNPNTGCAITCTVTTVVGTTAPSLIEGAPLDRS